MAGKGTHVRLLLGRLAAAEELGVFGEQGRAC